MKNVKPTDQTGLTLTSNSQSSQSSENRYWVHSIKRRQMDTIDKISDNLQGRAFGQQVTTLQFGGITENIE